MEKGARGGRVDDDGVGALCRLTLMLSASGSPSSSSSLFLTRTLSPPLPLSLDVGVFLCRGSSTRTVRTMMEVSTASRNKPRTILVLLLVDNSGESVVTRLATGTGMRPRTRAEAAMPPANWAMRRKSAQMGEITRVRGLLAN